MTRSVFIMAALALLGGCGAPRYQIMPSPADNTVRFYRGNTGEIEAEARIGTDSEGMIEGLEFTRGSTTAKLGKAQFAAKPSATYAASAGPMMAYRDQTQAFYEGNALLAQTHWAGFNTMWSNTLQAAAPIAGMYLQGKLTQQQIEMQTPNMREELIRSFAGGLVNVPQLQSLLTQFPSSVGDGLFNDPRVIAAIEAMRRDLEALKPTSKPSD